ncbi:transposase, partial [Paraburkholderia sp. GAS448]
AKQEGAIIYWGDEMGLRSDHVSGTSFALKGETPVVRATGQRFGCNMISAITNRGELSFTVFEGTFKNATFIEFMKRMLKQATRKIYLIVDGHPVHRSVAVGQFVADNAKRLRLIRLPGYCPELNPDELLNQDVKTQCARQKQTNHQAGNDRHGSSSSASPAEGASRNSQSVQGKARSLRRLMDRALFDALVSKVNGQWKYLYRAVDKAGNTIDFLLRTHRDKTAARGGISKNQSPRMANPRR